MISHAPSRLGGVCNRVHCTDAIQTHFKFFPASCYLLISYIFCSWSRCAFDYLSACSCNFSCDRFQILSNLLVAEQLPSIECWLFPLSWWLLPDPSCYIICECISIVFRPIYSGPATCATASLRPHQCVYSDCNGRSASYCLSWASSHIVSGSRHCVWNWWAVPYTPSHFSLKLFVNMSCHICYVFVDPVQHCLLHTRTFYSQLLLSFSCAWLTWPYNLQIWSAVLPRILYKP